MSKSKSTRTTKMRSASKVRPRTGVADLRHPRERICGARDGGRHRNRGCAGGVRPRQRKRHDHSRGLVARERLVR
jgi:hypothetical protein